MFNKKVNCNFLVTESGLLKLFETLDKVSVIFVWYGIRPLAYLDIFSLTIIL